MRIEKKKLCIFAGILCVSLLLSGAHPLLGHPIYAAPIEQMDPPIRIEIQMQNAQADIDGQILTEFQNPLQVRLFVQNEMEGLGAIYYSLQMEEEEEQHQVVFRQPGEAETVAAETAAFDHTIPDAVEDWQMEETQEDRVITASRLVSWEVGPEFTITLGCTDLHGRFYGIRNKYHWMEEPTELEELETPMDIQEDPFETGMNPEEEETVQEEMNSQEIVDPGILSEEETIQQEMDPEENLDTEITPVEETNLLGVGNLSEPLEEEKVLEPESEVPTESSTEEPESESLEETSTEETEPITVEEHLEMPEEQPETPQEEVPAPKVVVEVVPNLVEETISQITFEPDPVDFSVPAYDFYPVYEQVPDNNPYPSYEPAPKQESYPEYVPTSAQERIPDTSPAPDAASLEQIYGAMDAPVLHDPLDPEPGGRKEPASPEDSAPTERETEPSVPKNTAKAKDKVAAETKNTGTGSHFDLSAIQKINGQYLQTAEDLVIYEENPTAIPKESVQIAVSRNGEVYELEQGTDYTFQLVGDNAQKKIYKYKIHSDVFAQDGDYRVFLESKDQTGNYNRNEEQDASIRFGVDTTEPLIIAAEPTEEMAQKEERQVRIRDDQNLADVAIYVGDHPVAYESDGDVFRFRVPETEKGKEIKVVARDAAGNSIEKTVPQTVAAGALQVREEKNAPIGLIFIGIFLLGGAGAILFRKKRAL